jgi:ATP-binding cassette subfamily C protein
MAFHDKITASFELLRRLLFLVRPYGLGKAGIVFLVLIAQGLLQVAGVGSVFPFLALASNPEGFRQSSFGRELLSWLPPMANMDLLFWAGFISVVTLVASSAVNMLSDYVRARYSQGLGHWLRVQLLTGIAAQPWAYFLQRNSGELLKKAAGDVRFMVDAVLMPLLEAMSRFVTAACLVAMIVFLDWRVALAAAAGLSLYYAIVFRVIQTKRRAWSEQYKTADRGVMREAHQLLGGMKTIKIRHAESHFVGRFAQNSKAVADILSKTPLLVHLPKHVLEPVAFGSVILAVVLYSRGGGDLSAVFPLVGVIGLAGYRLLPAAQLLYSQIIQAVLCRHGVDEVYDEMKLFAPGNIREKLACDEPLRWRDSIGFDNVSFRYAEAVEPVLHSLSFTIPKHASLAVVGATGAGKSTLVDLLMGLHRPTAGMITVDGKPLDEGTLRSWQAGIGYVPQEIFLIDDTIARNIALGVPDAEIDMDRVIAAADAARIRDFIEKQLPDGFKTVVGERGMRLSGGQRQRIALARALYPQPELLILDEATSALDNQTEAEVTEAIKSLRGRVTMVVVAHRLSTVEHCDLKLELKGGGGRVTVAS